MGGMGMQQGMQGMQGMGEPEPEPEPEPEAVIREDRVAMGVRFVSKPEVTSQDVGQVKLYLTQHMGLSEEEMVAVMHRSAVDPDAAVGGNEPRQSPDDMLLPTTLEFADDVDYDEKVQAKDENRGRGSRVRVTTPNIFPALHRDARRLDCSGRRADFRGPTCSRGRCAGWGCPHDGPAGPAAPAHNLRGQPDRRRLQHAASCRPRSGCGLGAASVAEAGGACCGVHGPGLPGHEIPLAAARPATAAALAQPRSQAPREPPLHPAPASRPTPRHEPSYAVGADR